MSNIFTKDGKKYIQITQDGETINLQVKGHCCNMRICSEELHKIKLTEKRKQNLLNKWSDCLDFDFSKTKLVDAGMFGDKPQFEINCKYKGIDCIFRTNAPTGTSARIFIGDESFKATNKEKTITEIDKHIAEKTVNKII